jgi:hypothetical protein
MSNIKFVSHEAFPEDPYTKEMVYLLLDDKFRVAYSRKLSKNGGQFWSVGNLSVVKDGVKTYYEAFLQDSTFMEKDIKKLLDDRIWEKKNIKPAVINDEEIPF